MEGFFGIPHIANQIFETLTTQDLGNCREVSPEWFNFVEEEKILWKRIRNIHPCINGRNLLHVHAITGQQTRFETAFNFSNVMGKKHAQFVDDDHIIIYLPLRHPVCISVAHTHWDFPRHGE